MKEIITELILKKNSIFDLPIIVYLAPTYIFAYFVAVNDNRILFYIFILFISSYIILLNKRHGLLVKNYTIIGSVTLFSSTIEIITKIGENTLIDIHDKSILLFTNS